MKHYPFLKQSFLMISVVLLLLAMLNSTVSFAAYEGADITPDEIVAELKIRLDLNDQQVKDLTVALSALAKNLDVLIAKQEAAKEEGGDPNEFIKGVKQAQEDYQKKLKGILTDKQMEGYSALREEAIMNVMKDLAEIKLLDIQPHVGFSDEQLKKLIPVMAESVRSFMKIAWEHAGKHLRLGQKIRVMRDLKRIQSKSQKQVQQILTGDQYQKWEDFKKQQQEQQKK